jgi:hypothetical protein
MSLDRKQCEQHAPLLWMLTYYPILLCAQVKKNLKEEPQKSSPQTDSPLDTIFVSSEVAPWSKTGGLGDVAGSLPIALASRGHRVMVVAPR